MFFSFVDGYSAGVVNPSYEEQNFRNEQTRFPYLARASERNARAAPPLPQQRNSDSFDDIAEEKLRVSMSCDDDVCSKSRPTSGNYVDMDEDRYTTLKSVMAAKSKQIGSVKYTAKSRCIENGFPEMYSLLFAFYTHLYICFPTQFCSLSSRF